MGKLGFQTRLGLVFAAILAAFWVWQNPGVTGSRLGHDEIERYLAVIDRAAPMAPAEKAEAITRIRAWAQADDGKPVYMLNLMRFFPKVKSVPGGPDAGMTPMQSNQRYEDAVLPMLLTKGGTAVITSTSQGANVLPYAGQEDNWSRMLVIRYPNRRAFLELLSDPAYHKEMPYKLAALEIILSPFSKEMVLPDPSLALATILLIAFLTIGWWRAARRTR